MRTRVTEGFRNKSMRGTKRWFYCIEKIKPSHFALLIFCLSCVVRLGLLFADGERMFRPQSAEAFNIARTLATTGTFADAFGPKTGPTAHTTPLYPLFMAACMKVAGEDGWAYAAIRLTNIAASSLSYAMLLYIAPWFGFPCRAATAGGLIGAFFPYGRMETEGSFENFVATCVLLLLIGYAFGRKESVYDHVGRSAVVGAMSCVLILLCASFVPVVVYILYAFVRQQERRRWLKHSALLITIIIAGLSPWMWRNYLVFDQIIPLRGNFWLEVSVSNNDLAGPSLEGNIMRKVYQLVHPYSNRQQREIIARIGETEYMKEKRREALIWIRRHPGKFLRLVLQRARDYWFPEHRDVLFALVLSVYTIFAMIGYCVGNTEAYRARRLRLVVVIVLLWMIYLVVQVSVRYRYPTHILLLLPAGNLAAHVLRGLAGMRQRLSGCHAT